TLKFSGTPANGDVGSIAVKVTARDGSGATAINTFNINVANVNDAPMLNGALPDRTINEDGVFSNYSVANSFSNRGNSGFSYSATMADGSALPSWLKFDSSTLTFSGTPSAMAASAGKLAVNVAESQLCWDSKDGSYSVPTSSQVFNIGLGIDFAVPANTFKDVDLGDVLTYSATKADGSALPSWLKFDSSTLKFSGIPANSAVGKISVKVIATDRSGATASDIFDIVVNNVNDAPIANVALANQVATEKSLFSHVLPLNAFIDVDVGDVLTYSATKADGSALPSWLKFDASTMKFSGTPANGDVGIIAVKVTAKDRAGATTISTFNINVANVNDAPMLNAALPDKTVNNGGYSVAGSFRSGSQFTHTATMADGSPLPNWLKFDGATRTFSGKPPAGISKVSVNVKEAETTYTYDSKSGASSPVTQQVDAKAFDINFGFDYGIPSGTFKDIDLGDVLTYSATKADGSALPSWLKFDASTMKFSGIPANNDVGKISVKVIATDKSGATASDIFDININNSINTLTPLLPPMSEIVFGKGGDSFAPVVLDLDGNGLEFLDIADANVLYDVNKDGFLDHTAWANKGDGILVYDKGTADKSDDDISFVSYKEGAKSDLEGLRAFDTNGNAKLDTGDSEWASFSVWQDKNSDGKMDDGEVLSLADFGIKSIDLVSDGRAEARGDIWLFGGASYEKVDGTTGLVGDVVFKYVDGAKAYDRVDISIDANMQSDLEKILEACRNFSNASSGAINNQIVADDGYYVSRQDIANIVQAISGMRSNDGMDVLSPERLNDVSKWFLFDAVRNYYERGKIAV
ncbi:MAG: putative Ig domain-containing protein, partial [Deltaproteobacteria bacterium]|nr:putative Ig domain-containing protein [Deltaproteobacteria bacterium]